MKNMPEFVAFFRPKGPDLFAMGGGVE